MNKNTSTGVSRPAEWAAALAALGSMALLLAFPTSLFPRTLVLVATGTAVTALVRSLANAKLGDPGRSGFTRLHGFCLAGLALVFISLLPLPLSATRVFGETRYEQNLVAEAALEQAHQLGVTAEPDGRYALTRNKAGTARIMLLTLAMFGMFGLASALPTSIRRLLLRLITMTAAGIGIAGFISVRFVPQGHTLWWVHPVGGSFLPGPLACFINPNHFAGFLAITVPAAAALLIEDCIRKKWFRAMLSLALLPAFGLGLLVSGSRGGLLAFLAGLAALAAAAFVRKRPVMALSAVLLTAGAVAALPQVLDSEYRSRIESVRNIGEDDSYRTRTRAWKDSLRIVRAYPLTGCGANGFRMVYPQFRTDSSRARMTHAENEYVQIATDTGLAGLAIVCAIVLLLVREVNRRRTPDFEAAQFAFYGLAAATAVHALVDFPLHIPLYAVTVALLAGLALPAPSGPGGSPPAGRRGAVPVSLAAAAVLALASALAWGRHLHLDSYGHIRSAGAKDLPRILAWAPTSWQTWERLGTLALRRGHYRQQTFGEGCMTQAAGYDPNNYRLWYRIGHARLEIGDLQGAREAQKRVQALRDWYWPQDIMLNRNHTP